MVSQDGSRVNKQGWKEFNNWFSHCYIVRYSHDWSIVCGRLCMSIKVDVERCQQPRRWTVYWLAFNVTCAMQVMYCYCCQTCLTWCQRQQCTFNNGVLTDFALITTSLGLLLVGVETNLGLAHIQPCRRLPRTVQADLNIGLINARSAMKRLAEFMPL